MEPEKHDEHQHSSPEKPPVTVSSEGEFCIWAILGLIFAFLMPILGIIFSIMGLVKISKNPSLKGKGLAIAGLIISIFSIIAFILIISIFAVALFGVFGAANLIPELCTISGGAGFCEANIDGDTLTIKFDSGFNSAVTVDSLTITDETNEEVQCLPRDVSIKPTDSQIFSCSTSAEEGELNTFSFEMEYLSSETGMKRTASGDILVKG